MQLAGHVLSLCTDLVETREGKKVVGGGKDPYFSRNRRGTLQRKQSLRYRSSSRLAPSVRLRAVSSLFKNRFHHSSAHRIPAHCHPASAFRTVQLG